MIRFRFSSSKAIAYIAERARLELRVDVRMLLGTLYLADKMHFLDRGTPVFGGDYVAEPIGPVHAQVRRMLMGDPAPLCETGLGSYPWTVEGRILSPVRDLPAPDALTSFSLSNVTALRSARAAAYESCFRNPLRDRPIHDLAWSRAQGGRVRFEDMALEADIIVETLIGDVDPWSLTL